MRVNRKIKDAFSEIAKESVKLHNDPERQTRYVRRMVKVYDEHFTDEEKIYIVSSVMELLHYRNLSVDPDNMLTISNIRIRTLFFVFMSTLVLMVAGATLFKTNTSVLQLSNLFVNFLKMFSL